MEFSRFSLGLRFALVEEHALSPRDCWRILLDRISGEQMESVRFYGAYNESPGEPERAYICMMTNLSLAVGKGLCRRMRRMPYLLSYLTIYQPFILNNRLEKCGDIVYLGRVGQDGGVEAADETLRDLHLNDAPTDQNDTKACLRMLISPYGHSFGRVTSAQAVRLIMRAASGLSECVRTNTQLFADGGEGTLDALVCSANGRYACGRIEGENGDVVPIRYGVLPDRTIALEAYTLTQRELNQALSMPQNRGFTRYMVALDGREAPREIPDGITVTFLGAAMPSEDASERISYRSAIDAILEAGAFERKLKQADILVTATRLLDPNGMLLSAATDDLLFRARKANIPYALIAFAPDGTFCWKTSFSPMARLACDGSYDDAAKQFCNLAAQALMQHG